ncbi:MAG: hypothetical protein LT071_12330 [Nocardioides sp.]|nr:hypothetical protein [Nocardioides sp.]
MRTGGRSTAAALAVAASLLAACAADGPRRAPAPSGPPRAADPGWQRVEVPGEIRAMDGTYSARLGIAGVLDDGGPLAAAVKADRVNHVAGRVPVAHPDGLHGITGDIENDGLVEQSDPGSGVPARLHMGWIGDDKWDPDPSSPAYPELEEWHTSTLRDDRGRAAVWASLLYDDEGDVRAVGVVPVGARWRIRAWEQGGRGWHLVDAGRPLFLGSEPSTTALLTSTEEVMVNVAGVIGRGRNDPEPSLWRLESDPYGRHEWGRARLAGGADVVTDVHSWALGTWVAGTRDGRPMVWDWSDDAGERIPLPDIELDPADPVVRILHGPVVWPLTLAVQSPGGPSVWIRKDDQWQEVVAPPGRLTLAEGSSYGPYLLIDDALWFWSMPYEEWGKQ